MQKYTGKVLRKQIVRAQSVNAPGCPVDMVVLVIEVQNGHRVLKGIGYEQPSMAIADISDTVAWDQDDNGTIGIFEIITVR